MLKKLYRHEFYSLFRNLLPVYIGIVVIAVFSRVTFLLPSPEEEIASAILETFRVSSVILYFIGVFAMFIIGLVITVTRFYKNLLSHEGYLTFTLPFKATQHLNCKLICACTVTLINFAVLLLSVFVYGVGTELFGDLLEALGGAFSRLTDFYQTAQLVLAAAELILLMLVSLVSSLLMFYAAMAIGQQFKNRIGASVVAYIAINAIRQTASMFLMLPLTLIGITETELTAYSGFVSMISFYGFLIVFEAVCSVALYLVTRHLLTNRLNLE